MGSFPDESTPKYRRRSNTNDPSADAWLELNTTYSETWPNITRKGEAPTDADQFNGQSGKFEKFFDPNPGTGS